MAAPPDDTPGNGVTTYRLTQIEKRLEGIEAQMNARLDAVQGSIASLAFVRKDVYESEHRALADKVDSAHSLAMWALGTTITIIGLVSVLIGILKLVAS